MKAVAYATLAIVALIGIVGVLAYSVYQMQYSGYTSTQLSAAAEDIARSRLEATKAQLTQDLKFSGHQAMLITAAQGGTIYPVTYWWCNSNPQPPEPEEFAFALSNFTLNYLNLYINVTNTDPKIKNLNISVKEYGCVAIDNPGKEKCIGKNSANCESFTTATFGGGNIEVKSPSYKSYIGNLATDVELNRGYWIYWNLYTAAKERNLLMRLVNQEMRERCTGPEDTATKLRASLDDICKGFEALFDEYVKCTYEILCLGEGQTCLNTPCEREPIANLCYSSSSLKAENEIKRKPQGIEMQAQTASARINFILTDYKYNIPRERGLKPLKFVITAIFEAGRQECRPIDIEEKQSRNLEEI